MKCLIGLAVCVLTLIGGADVAHAGMMYQAFLNGPSEDPPNTSAGTGFAQVTIDTIAHTLSVQVTFSDLTTPTTASHIHASTAIALMGNAGVATQVPTFMDFPLGVTSGTYSQTFDTSLTSTFNPAFVMMNGGTAAGAEAALASAMQDGKAYLNIHTNMFPGGEIRGFLTPTAVAPEPSTLSLLAVGGLGLFLARCRQRCRRVSRS